MARNVPIGIELVKRNIVTEADVKEAIRHQKNHPNKKLVDIIHFLNLCDENELLKALGEILNEKVVLLNNNVLRIQPTDYLSLDVCKRSKAVPFEEYNGKVKVCFSDLTNKKAVEQVRLLLLHNGYQMERYLTFDSNLENTLKSVSIKDIVFNETPTNGIPNLYYKSLTSFATPDVLEENKIDSTLDFSVTSSDEIDYSSPTLYNNCANPITLCYVNSNIVNNYTIDNSNSIAYDGSLLKSCNVLLNNIKAKISFTIYIENNQGEKFRCPVYIDIPLGEGDVSIYDGSYTYTYNPEYVFYKY